MRLWLNRSAEISLREQLITQVVLGILTREILPGQKLPSTRELARRFGIHPNTASACYRELERDGWLELRHGSGVFVANRRPSTPLSPEMAVDQLIGELAARARKIGASDSLLRARLRRWLSLAPLARWLVIEPDPELRKIVTVEMESSLALPVAACTPDECGEETQIARSIPVCLPSKAAAVRKLLPAVTVLTVFQVNPVASALEANLQRYLPEHSADLIGIASRWGEFQRIGRTMIVAAGLKPENLLVRDATRPGWKRGLESTSGVICDIVTAQQLPKKCFPIIFHLLNEASIAQLRTLEAEHSEASPTQPAL
ncbi:MAG: GntR family transcriptional regulator [Terracidiphilus sp.]